MTSATSLSSRRVMLGAQLPASTSAVTTSKALVPRCQGDDHDIPASASARSSARAAVSAHAGASALAQ